MMQPIIENFMEVVKKGRRRELHFHDHGNIIDTFESQYHITWDFYFKSSEQRVGSHP